MKRVLFFFKEKENKSVNIYLYEIIGLMISFIISKKTFFDYAISEYKTIEEEWDYLNDIYFRLDKFYDNLLARINLVDICVYILNNTNEDAVPPVSTNLKQEQYTQELSVFF